MRWNNDVTRIPSAPVFQLSCGTAAISELFAISERSHQDLAIGFQNTFSRAGIRDHSRHGNRSYEPGKKYVKIVLLIERCTPRHEASHPLDKLPDRALRCLSRLSILTGDVYAQRWNCTPKFRMFDVVQTKITVDDRCYFLTRVRRGSGGLKLLSRLIEAEFEGFEEQILFGRKVPIEPSMGQSDTLHQRQNTCGSTLAPECSGSLRHNPLVGLGFVLR
jgi:hypothetical protein